MKQTKKRTKNVALSRQKLNELIVTLESCHNALTDHKNFNLAEVHINEYLDALPKQHHDATVTKSIEHALKKRDFELLRSAVESELERLRLMRINLLRDNIAQRKVSHY